MRNNISPFYFRVYDLERELVLRPPPGFEMGGSPRTRFPLVVLLLINEDDLECELGGESTVALVNVIHVKDSTCPMDSSFVYKLSKMVNGQTLNVTNLFSRAEEERGVSLCVVCLTDPVEVGLLPCRHFCVCEECYERLPNVKRCPICRSYIVKFFRHKAKAVPTPVENEQPFGGESPDHPDQAQQASVPEPLPSSSTFGWLSSKVSRLLKLD